LGDLGLDVHRITGDFDLTTSDVVVMQEPIATLTDSDVQSLDAFMRGGGEVIVAVGAAGGGDVVTPFLDHLGVFPVGAVTGGSATGLAPVNPSVPVGSVDVGPVAVDLGTRGGTALLGLDRSVVMREITTGSGRALVLGSDYPMSNEGLRVTRPDDHGQLQPTGSDASSLVLAMLGQARPQTGPPLRVGFDEFHHGEGAHGGLGAIFYGPLGLAVVLAAGGVLALIAGSGRRLGRPIPAGDPARVPTAAQYVDAMAHLFARSAQRGAVADRFAQELKDRVGAAAGIDPHIDDAAFVAALSGYGAGRQDEVGGTLWRARTLAVGAPTEAQLMTLVQEIDGVEAHWAAGAPT
jgi:hypothetical protein